MLRNREFKISMLLFIAIFSGSLLIATYTDVSSVKLLMIFGIFYILVYIIFTSARYFTIRQLSEYVREIHSGNYSLDVRDNVEGELSILKNEIYKVTNMLAEQGHALQDDKIHLMDSISDISHQLKTPLTSMTMMADLLSSPDLPPEKRDEFSELLLKQLERINWLVSSLLKLSKIDAGTVAFKKEHVQVRELIDFTLERIQMSYKQEQIQIEKHGDEDVYLQCDKNWTTEALINVINNCMQHSPPNETIIIDWKTNAIYTQIVVTDHGPGIPLAERTQIFNRFFKGKHASEESVGIGLAMAYSIINNQNGNIEIESNQGRGTSFIMTFYHS